MSVSARITRSICALMTFSVAIAAACTIFALPASAISYTGWDFDFDIQPSVITVGQDVNVTIHAYYYGNDSTGKPFQKDAGSSTVTITSDFFNTISTTDTNGWLINTDHPDVPGNYTYTAKVIFDANTKTKTFLLVVYPAGTVIPSPAAAATPTLIPPPTPVAGPVATDNVTDVEPDQVNLSNLDQPLLPSGSNNTTGAPTDNPYVMEPVAATPTAKPAPSALLSGLSAIAVLALIAFVMRKRL